MIYKIFGENYVPKFSLPIAGKLSKKDFIKIDLSVNNPELQNPNTDSLQGLSDCIFEKIKSVNVKGAYGGYNEKRALYKRSEHFGDQSHYRSIHLGIDFWLPAGTQVIATMPGRVHSFANNSNRGDYGPTIVLEHFIGNEKIHALYGHLSKSSLEAMYQGKIVARGEVIGQLGKPEENVDWPPHLHFQLIKDMGEFNGDYPGVCYESEKNYYLKNCPNPLLYFGESWQKKLV